MKLLVMLCGLWDVGLTTTKYRGTGTISCPIYDDKMTTTADSPFKFLWLKLTSIWCLLSQSNPLWLAPMHDFHVNGSTNHNINVLGQLPPRLVTVLSRVMYVPPMAGSLTRACMDIMATYILYTATWKPKIMHGQHFLSFSHKLCWIQNDELIFVSKTLLISIHSNTILLALKASLLLVQKVEIKIVQLDLLGVG